MLNKKVLSVFLALLLLAGAAPAALAAPSDFLGQEMPDFSVTAVDGTVVTLSEILKEKDLVLVNFWATWCPPCRMEFPFMQKAYAEYQDRVAVIAMSVEPTDDLDTLRAFAQERGITFYVAQDEKKLGTMFWLESIPTTMAVDRFGRIAYVGVGSMLDPVLFTVLFDQFLGDDYTETKVIEREVTVPQDHYAIFFYDSETMEGVAGCSATFCTDMECTLAVSDETGLAVFTGTPQVYHIQVVSLPDGYELMYGDEEGDSERVGDLYILPLVRKGQ
ncbi:MAG: TlpA family protein disulfide reductase [Clostridia bacterium]|nr:TlpA family protein disulfide reductase [Clostridia bacterium]